MTRKDFQVIAEILAEIKPLSGIPASVYNILAKQNKNFDPVKFNMAVLKAWHSKVK